jgi:NitT/TauT family transport system permease protein
MQRLKAPAPKKRSKSYVPQAISGMKRGFRWWKWASNAALFALAAIVLFSVTELAKFLFHVTGAEWLELVEAGGLTLARVIGATLLGTIWAVPAGLAIGLSPKLSKALQPIVQVVASFPAPMLFPMVLAGMAYLGVGLNIGSVLLMLLGTQWYILFNVIAGAMAIPGDLKEAAVSFGLSPWQKWKALYLPATFPYLVTGWVTAAGGAWNASIVAEYISDTNHATGLGYMVTMSAFGKQVPLLVASVLVMSFIVVVFNRLVWKPLYRISSTRYSLSK